MAKVTILANKDQQYVIPQMCCVCGTSQTSAELQLGYSYTIGSTTTTHSFALPVCSEHAKNPTGVSMSAAGDILTFSRLDSSYAQTLLSMNLQTAVQDAKDDPGYENLSRLAQYFFYALAAGQEGEQLVVAMSMFNRLGVGEMIAQGLESGLLEEQITRTADHLGSGIDALQFVLALAGLEGIEKGIELANRLVHKQWINGVTHELRVRILRMGSRRPELVNFLNQLLRDSSLTYDVQKSAASALVLCDPTQLGKVMRDEGLDVKIRFDFIQELRDQELPVEDPDLIGEFYAKIKDDREAPAKMRREAAVALGEFKALLILTFLESWTRAVAWGVGMWFGAVFLLTALPSVHDFYRHGPRVYNFAVRYYGPIMHSVRYVCGYAGNVCLARGGLVFSSVISVLTFCISLLISLRGKLKNVKWYQKRRGDSSEYFRQIEDSLR